MPTELISIEEYCKHHHTEITFIDALEQSGLVEIIQVESKRCIDFDQLEQLEKFTTLYTELEINIPGIEVVNLLLEKLESMKHYIQELENKLHFYRD